MNKTIVVSAVVVLGLFSLMWWSKPTTTPVDGSNANTNSNPETKNALTAEEKLYDFGTISMANGKVTKVFKVTNSASEDITIKNIETSCMCTTAYLETASGEKGPFGMPGHGGGATKTNEIVKAGESRELKVIYDPNAHGPAGVGTIDRFIYLTDASGKILELEIKAIVTP